MTLAEAKEKAKEILNYSKVPWWLQQYKKYATQYFPSSVVYLAVNVNSEYDDSYYKNSIAYVIAYDAKGDEVNPTKATAKAAREAWGSLPMPWEPGKDEDPEYSRGHHGGETIVRLEVEDKEAPQIYIKE